MNWQLIAVLASAGVAMGVASVLGRTRGLEGRLWLLFGVIAVVITTRFVRERPFWHGATAGFLAGGLASMVQALFIATYLRNNADFVAAVPARFAPRVFVLLLTGPIAIVSGAVLGTACWLAARVVRGRT